MLVLFSVFGFCCRKGSASSPERLYPSALYPPHLRKPVPRVNVEVGFRGRTPSSCSRPGLAENGWCVCDH